MTTRPNQFNDETDYQLRKHKLEFYIAQTAEVLEIYRALAKAEELIIKEKRNATRDNRERKLDGAG